MTNEQVVVGENALGKERVEKHVEIHEAIYRMEEISVRLDDLIAQIEGPAPPATADPKEVESTPSLLNLLDGAPDVIQGNTNNALARIERLHELLF